MFSRMLCIGGLLLPLSCAAQTSDFARDLENILYSDLKKIESIGFINVRNKSKKSGIQLNTDELTDYLKLRYKNNFAGFPYRDQSGKLGGLKDAEKIGGLWCSVWTVGTDYPVAYHVACKIGSLKRTEIVDSEFLGYGNKGNVPDSIKKAIDDMVTEFALTFFRVRGEM